MGAASTPKDVCLIVAMCYNDKSLKDSSITSLEKKYGAIEFDLAPVLFSHTNYYGKEMGETLEKLYFSFKDYIYPGDLADIKNFTNSLELDSALAGKRNVNIDPGYIEVPKLILATTKNFSHRIYIGNKIYGDVQLYWQNGKFNANPWTYPDYKDEKVMHFFEQVRNEYFQMIKG